MSVCLPDTLNLALENVSGCCEQIPSSTDIELNRVHRSMMYWNSAMVLPCYGWTTDAWFYQQFHFWCNLVAGEQVFSLWWCYGEASALPEPTPPTRRCTICYEDGASTSYQQWTLVSAACDPLDQEFAVYDGNWSPCCAPTSDPGVPPGGETIECDLYATVTE